MTSVIEAAEQAEYAQVSNSCELAYWAGSSWLTRTRALEAPATFESRSAPTLGVGGTGTAVGAAAVEAGGCQYAETMTPVLGRSVLAAKMQMPKTATRTVTMPTQGAGLPVR